MRHFEQLDKDDHSRGRSRHKEMVRCRFRRFSRSLIRNFQFDLLPFKKEYRGFTY